MKVSYVTKIDTHVGGGKYLIDGTKYSLAKGDVIEIDSKMWLVTKLQNDLFSSKLQNGVRVDVKRVREFASCDRLAVDDRSAVFEVRSLESPPIGSIIRTFGHLWTVKNVKATANSKVKLLSEKLKSS